MDPNQEIARQQELIARLRVDIGRDLAELTDRLNPRAVVRRRWEAVDPRPAIRRRVASLRGDDADSDRRLPASEGAPDPETVRTVAAGVRGLVLNRTVIIGAVVFGAGCVALWAALRYRRP